MPDLPPAPADYAERCNAAIEAVEGAVGEGVGFILVMFPVPFDPARDTGQALTIGGNTQPEAADAILRMLGRSRETEGHA